MCVNELTINVCIALSVNELLKMKEDLTKERDDQLAEIVKLREQLADSQGKQQKLESDQEEAASKMQEVSLKHIVRD